MLSEFQKMAEAIAKSGEITAGSLNLGGVLRSQQATRIIDLVVASVLMSMGMMMLPPVVVSLPFKLIFFVLVDGWRLVAGSLVESFQRASGTG